MSDGALSERLGKAASHEAQRYSFTRMTSSFELLSLAELNRRGAAVGHAHALAS
jgi:hypothetical protein